MIPKGTKYSYQKYRLMPGLARDLFIEVSWESLDAQDLQSDMVAWVREMR